MNRQTVASSPLQLPVSFGPARRQEIGGRTVRTEALVHFNALLRTIHAAAPRVDADALVSLARRLQTEPVESTVGVVTERIGRVQILRQMLRDDDWALAPELRVRARLLLSYVDKHEDLIPDGVNLYGYLDDALMVELSWPRFEAEVQSYRDFCAYRAEHGGSDVLAAWQTDRQDAALWRRHRQDRRDRGYRTSAPQADAMLRVC
jgi:uncharacterized membrane protein YkvA (DUF1232 family)